MHDLTSFVVELLSPDTIIQRGGLLLLLFVIFSENGLFFAFFLPGDSLLFLAGMFCGLPVLDLPIQLLVFYIALAAFLGYCLSYLVGYKLGNWLLSKPDSFFFKRKYLNMASSYFEKRHQKAIVVGRFVPVIRTFLPLCLGLIKSDFRSFMIYNLIGAMVWSSSLVLAGFFLRVIFPDLIHYIGWIVLLILFITTIPLLRQYIKARKGKIDP